jgi:F-type H+-transporting ATPase subunit a
MATPTSHLSMTLALTFIVLGVTHLTALYLRPIKYIGNFIKIGPIVKARSLSQLGQAIFDFVLGLLDIIGEIAKVISLSCRLFGNMLAGELMVVVIAGLSMYTQFFAPIPFLILGLLSAVVQALVFALLSLNYISMAISSVEDEKTA